ncbi:MAG: diguanylate cyclase [Phenylobacterium sp.]|jgi:GGDEF domain-containing protein|nr:diguanylate cyclase [Phenylobacterium sp.]
MPSAAATYQAGLVNLSPSFAGCGADPRRHNRCTDTRACRGHRAVTLSIGIAEVGQLTQDGSVAQVIGRADEAMYAAKRAGRNGSATYLAARPGTGPG